MHGQLRIDELYAFVVVDEDGTEGIPAFNGPNGLVLPMVGADPARIRDLIPIANTIGKPYRILRFTTRADVTAEYPGRCFRSGRAEPR